MGYTHYWTQTRDFTATEWEQVCADIGAILKDVQHSQGIPLANGMGEPRTSPEFFPAQIAFNGLGDDSHESFVIYRRRPAKEAWQSRRGGDFCKTARKPYDLAVTACLSYLATITRRDDPATGEPIIGTETHSVSSDGRGSEWLDGVEEARRALPRYANQLDIPMPIMQRDRWCAPWVSDKAPGYEVAFCVDGRGYVLKLKTGESYCFESHKALAQFLDQTKRVTFRRGGSIPHPFNGARGWGDYGRVEENIWNATGCFDKTRHARIARAQAKVLATLFPVDPACAQQPPAYVRPGDMPENGGREFCYSVNDLLSLAEAA